MPASVCAARLTQTTASAGKCTGAVTKWNVAVRLENDDCEGERVSEPRSERKRLVCVDASQ